MAQDRPVGTRRRRASLAILAFALVGVAVGVAAWWAGAWSPSWGWAAVAAAGVLLTAQIILLLYSPRAATPEVDPEEGPPLLEETVLTVRCTHCGTRGDVVDDGRRPLPYSCPGCGKASDLFAPPGRVA